MIIPPFSVLTGPHLGTASTFEPSNARKTSMNQRLQQRPPRWWVLEYLLCEERLGELGLLNLEQRRLWGYLKAALMPTRSCRGQSWSCHSGA